MFGASVPPFNLSGKDEATTFLGGLISIAIIFFTLSFIIENLNQMIFFSEPVVSQISIQGTPLELSKIYEESNLGNTSFAI